jgi:Dolichyl-phosphate-mannose-protein mannosyltransferase
MKSDDTTAKEGPFENSQSRRARFAICLLIFLAAFGVRLLSWHDTRLEVGKVQTVVAEDYKRVARMLKEGGVASFLSSPPPVDDVNALLAHPPGYPILMSLIYSVVGESDPASQFAQIIFDGLAAVVAFLIVAELFSTGAAFIAGMLAAVSPQFAWNSVLLLPDSLAVLPILLAIYCLARAAKNPRLVTFIATGALVGISCWLRANAMLLTFFFAAAALLLVKRERRWRFSLAVIFGTLLIVLPLTIRNAIVFHRFIPLSLGAGQTLLEGIADYDREGRLGIPETDMGIMKMESEELHRPDYYATFFKPDGVERERWRLARGFGVIRRHPFWFSGVMARRAASMLRLERSRLVSTEPPVSHSLDAIDKLQPVWTNSPAELLAQGLVSQQAKAVLSPNGETLVLTGDGEKYGEQFRSLPIPVSQNNDYVFMVPIKIERGRMKIGVKDSSGKVYSSTIVETLETISPDAPPVNQIQLPFVATKDEQVRIVFSNEASTLPNPIAQIGPIKLFELGQSRFLWTRYPRFLIHAAQKLFLTAVMLPLAIMGMVLLISWRRWPALIILLVVPVYFFSVQSIVHTEYRYVLAVDYFLFALAAITVSRVINLVVARTSKLLARKS